MYNNVYVDFAESAMINNSSKLTRVSIYPAYL